MGACLLVSVAFVALSTGIDALLEEERAGTGWWTPWNRCLPGVAAPPPLASDSKRGGVRRRGRGWSGDGGAGGGEGWGWRQGACCCGGLNKK